ncbi:hypothetical protein LPH50_09280 [Xylella taiwanensis]|nr:hypothetical protein [Xylella taiwanensis]MCD8456134.1 hypothetical protein [Xylella taiwanensis]MCD8458540.1 hypothetical protein [Xylella taiwanensis]MCD8460675.1 hypothetical protein [Xylella taiwanensis]MCD8463263.1 hypothetical protein [Xylella taiwanensis]MCD8465180.1 hypothetical protein [Xylella taiwanensis]
MRTLSVAEVSEVSGGNPMTDGASIGAGFGAFGSIMTGATSAATIGASAATWGLLGAAAGGGWMVGTFIYNRFFAPSMSASIAY